MVVLLDAHCLYLDTRFCDLDLDGTAPIWIHGIIVFPLVQGFFFF